MHDENLLTRREFTLESALAILSGVAITVSGCGDDDSPVSPSPQAGDRVGTVSANHGHSAVVTAAQLTSPNTIALDIRGNADHTHTVNLTQAEVTSIGGGTRVSKLSTANQAHDHTVTFN